MNQAELQALQQALSNEARVLYCLGLRPTCDTGTGKTEALNYKTLLALLNAKQQTFALGRQINSLLEELVSEGLVILPGDAEPSRSLNGQSLTLPLAKMHQDDYAALHLQWQTMSMQWRPHDGLLDDLCRMVGIIDKAYSEEELGDFVVYWLGRPQMQFSQYQWTQKFVFQMKQRRLASGMRPLPSPGNNKQRVGSQMAEPEAGLQADDNARKLVEKYSKKGSVDGKPHG